MLCGCRYLEQWLEPHRNFLDSTCSTYGKNIYPKIMYFCILGRTHQIIHIPVDEYRHFLQYLEPSWFAPCNSWGTWSVHWRTYLIRFARWSSSQLAFVPNTFNDWSSSSGSRCCGRWFNVIGKASELVLLALAHLNNVAIEIELR
jgi:hypothetical protein